MTLAPLPPLSMPATGASWLASSSSRRSTILDGLRRRHPSDIPRLVIAVVISSVKHVVILWTRPYVAVERLERGLPLGAYSDPSTAIAGVSRVRLIKTSPPHVAPGVVLRCVAHSVSRSGRKSSFSAHTPARHLPSFEEYPFDDLLGAAVTSTHPHSSTMPVVRCPAENRQPPEHLTNQI